MIEQRARRDALHAHLSAVHREVGVGLDRQLLLIDPIGRHRHAALEGAVGTMRARGFGRDDVQLGSDHEIGAASHLECFSEASGSEIAGVAPRMEMRMGNRGTSARVGRRPMTRTAGIPA